jgi:hypothetical protein
VPVDGIDADELESDVLVVVEWDFLYPIESRQKPGFVLGLLPYSWFNSV